MRSIDQFFSYMYFEVSLHPNNDIIVSTVCIESRLGPLRRRQYETRGIVVLWYRCVVAAWRRCVVASQHPRSCCCCSTRAASCCVAVVCKWRCTGRISLSGGCWIKRSMVNGVERSYGRIELATPTLESFNYWRLYASSVRYTWCVL